MERRVWHPGTAQMRRPLLVGEGGGTFPGRLPFIDPLRAQRLLRSSYSHEEGRGFPDRPKKFVTKP